MQIEVYKIIRTLLEETDKRAFGKMLESTLRKLIDNPLTHDFGIYFQNEYPNCVSYWAY